MPSINVDLNFFSHRKTMRLAAQLGDQAVTCLIRLWCYTAQHYPETGSLKDLRDSEIEYIMQWRGEPGVLVRTLIGIGFLDVIDSSCYIHGWGEHAHHLTVYRERARKAAQIRHGQNVMVTNVASEISVKQIEHDASSMLQAKRQLIKSTTSASSMLQAVLDPQQARHQYNTRQDNTIQKEEKSIACQVSKKPSRPALVPDDEWLKAIKTDPIYAGIDIDIQFRKASAWYPAHGRKLTRRAFIKWLIKEMDNKPMDTEKKKSPMFEMLKGKVFD